MSKLKQLQNNFTTPEQSYRLLELGVPIDTADCVYAKSIYPNEYIILLGDMRVIPSEKTWNFTIYRKIHKTEKTDFVPCWSVGRLIEIAWICHNSYGFFMTMCTSISRIFKAEQSIIEIMIDCLFDNTIDFSKLEE